MFTSLRFSLFSGLNEIQYGSIDNFKLNVKVENKKENAFLAKMTVEYADDFALIGVRFKDVSMVISLLFKISAENCYQTIKKKDQ